MGYKSKIAIIIPARYDSSRFPGKPLAKILDKELIVWVAELCEKAISKSNVYIATDNDLIEEKVKLHGFKVIRTKADHLTGTDRVYEACNHINADIIINVQGDEPLIDPKDIKKIIKSKIQNPNYIIKGYSIIKNIDDLKNKNVPKILFNEKKIFIYESRNMIPGSKNNKSNNIYYKGVCIYAFNKAELKNFYDFGRKSSLEEKEDIEILRFLEIGKKIKLVETNSNSIAVDTPSDIIKVEREIKKNYHE